MAQPVRTAKPATVTRSRDGWAAFALAVASALVVARPIAAHHSFAMFDTTNRVTLTGTVSTFEWTNPHVILEVDVPDGSGIVKQWTVELGSPSILLRGGWKYTDLKHGDRITLLVNPLKSGQPGGLLVQVTLPDGRMLGNGGPPPAGSR